MTDIDNYRNLCFIGKHVMGKSAHSSLISWNYVCSLIKFGMLRGWSCFRNMFVRHYVFSVFFYRNIGMIVGVMVGGTCKGAPFS